MARTPAADGNETVRTLHSSTNNHCIQTRDNDRETATACITRAHLLRHQLTNHARRQLHRPVLHALAAGDRDENSRRHHNHLPHEPSQTHTPNCPCAPVPCLPHLGGHRSAPVSLQRLQLLLHHLEKVLHFLDFTTMTVLYCLYLCLALIQFLL